MKKSEKNGEEKKDKRIKYRKRILIENTEDPRYEQTTAINLRGVPAILHSQFKTYCARRCISMTDKIIKMIKNELKRHPDG